MPAVRTNWSLVHYQRLWYCDERSFGLWHRSHTQSSSVLEVRVPDHQRALLLLGYSHVHRVFGQSHHSMPTQLARTSNCCKVSAREPDRRGEQALLSVPAKRMSNGLENLPNLHNWSCGEHSQQ